MSDDLISRKELLEVIDISFIIPILKMNLRPEHEAVLKIREIIMNMPIAFDKEKVMEELNNSFERSVAEILDCIGSSYTIADFSLEKFKRKICCIVEKGGIEEE